jgi:signal transduction histidine kinase
MKDRPRLRILTVADSAYGALLHAYPAAHRHEYGPCMGQLFRDLCRDAIAQDGLSGLIALWVRALLDVARAAIVEHMDEKSHTWGESVLDTHGLGPALRAYAEHLENEAAFAVHLAITGDLSPLSAQAERALFEVTQEAASNAKRHARPDNVWIDLVCQRDMLALRIRDDGQGFDMAGARASFRPDDRVAPLKGDFAVESAVGKGTTVRFVSPLTAT